MRIFKTKWFVRYIRQEHISDHGLRDAIERAERGLVDADLGGGVIKQRVARTGQGRSGGYRMLIAYRFGNRAVFMYGIAKNDRGILTKTNWQHFERSGRHGFRHNRNNLTMPLKRVFWRK